MGGRWSQSFSLENSGLTTLRPTSHPQHVSCRATETSGEASVSQEYHNQLVGANMAAGQTSFITELRVVVSASDERGHEGHECVWD